MRAFAGEDYEVPVIEPEATRLLSRVDEHATHYAAVMAARWTSDGSFAADITFDPDGVVVDYPGIARRLDQGSATIRADPGGD